jgi:hypothetical protein
MRLANLFATGALLFGLLLVGCGSSTGGKAPTDGGDQTAPFVGAWGFMSGSFQTDCTPAIPSFDLTGDVMNVTKDDGTHIVAMFGAPNLMCFVKCTVDGDVANAEPGQTCGFDETVSVGGSTPTPVSISVALSTWTLSVSGDVMNLTSTGTGNADNVILCSPVAVGTATRSADGGSGGSVIPVDGGDGG